MKIGDPLDRSTDHGPQNHKVHLDSLLSYIKKGQEEGATLAYGGKQLDRPGNTCGDNVSAVPGTPQKAPDILDPAGRET